jgi:hypothetical protein
MNSQPDSTILKLAAELTIFNARVTANLLNDGDPITAINAKPGSLARANQLRGLAADLQEQLNSRSTNGAQVFRLTL